MDPGDVLALTQALVRVPSITPQDLGCQEILIGRLAALGFTIHRLPFGPVANFYARRGATGPNLCLAGHTDVVPTGDPGGWRHPPFAGVVQDGRLWGRGVCDMKGGLAAMVAAVERFVPGQSGLTGSLSFLVTGDEEGDAVDGTVKVLEWLQGRGERLDWCVVGEPSSQQRLGDCIKNGRRGSLNGALTVRGVQGHVAYPHLARNPIHEAVGALDRLARLSFDQGSPDFDPTCLQFTALQAGSGATNVIPSQLTANFNIRFSTANTPATLEARVRAELDRAGLDYDLAWSLSGHPFLTQGGALLTALQRSVTGVTGVTPVTNTGGGTSDARFIARVCPQTIEFGLTADSIHKVDESCPVADLEQLTGVYQRLLAELVG